MNNKTSKISNPNGTKPLSKRSAKPGYWICIIGETEWNDLPDGADSQIRQATKKAFKKLTGHDCSHCWSGWSGDKKTVDKLLKAWSYDFDPCDECDRPDACEDFGCAFKAGLGHLVENDDLPF